MIVALLLSAQLTVFAASSLRESFQKIAALFESTHPGEHVLLDFAGSQELRAQLEHGAPCDVFASADTAPMDALVKAGLAHGPRIFARNELAIVVEKGNPRGVKGLADLQRLDRLVLAAPEVPVGKYARQVLARRGLHVEAKVISRELNVRQVAQKVALGEAEAGIVYRTDAQAFRGRLDAVALPEADNVIAQYPAAAVSGRKEAAEFVELLLSPPAQQLLVEAGFLGAR